ncbi:MAG: helix-turn-helix transcriptional regulator, partial [Terriglobia bacterium]
TRSLLRLFAGRGVVRFRKPLMDRRIQIVSLALETDFRRAWGIVQLGQLVNLSGSRLRHLFKAEMDQTPAQYLKAIRMSEAATLLRTTFLSVKEIRNRVGISNESHFVHEFKKAHGLAPSKYRREFTVATPVE